MCRKGLSSSSLCLPSLEELVPWFGVVAPRSPPSVLKDALASLPIRRGVVKGIGERLAPEESVVCVAEGDLELLLFLLLPA